LRDRKDGPYPPAGMMDASNIASILHFLVFAFVVFPVGMTAILGRPASRIQISSSTACWGPGHVPLFLSVHPIQRLLIKVTALLLVIPSEAEGSAVPSGPKSSLREGRFPERYGLQPVHRSLRMNAALAAEADVSPPTLISLKMSGED